MLRIFRGTGLDFASLVKTDTPPRAYRVRPVEKSVLGCDSRPGLEVLVRRAVLALGERRPLAGLALPRRRPATGNATVEGAGLDLGLDERTSRRDALADRPRDLCLRGNREVTPDVLEERSLGLREVERIGRKPLHRL